MTLTRPRRSVFHGFVFPLLFCIAATAAAQNNKLAIPPSGVIGFDQAMLVPDYWIARAPSPDKVLMSRQQIDDLNARTFAADPAMHDLAKVGPALSREQVLLWLKDAAEPLTKPLVDAAGNAIPKAAMEAIEANIGADRIPATTPTRYGLSVRRAQLRTYPTSLQAFPSKDLLDFESFQGGTLFPGDPVVVAHASADGQWLLVLSEQAPAWVARADIAEGAATEVFAYAGKQPFRVVTGDKVRTVFTPEAPEVSELQLDMGVRVPLARLPEGEPVNGQGPYVSWAIDLPVRREDGSLAFKAALLQKIKDTSPEYLPLTKANIIRQGFKFLGERYGWGHLYNARDCSGFTGEVYRSMGIILPPNSGAQGRSPALQQRVFSASDSHQARVEAVLAAQVGDLVVVPGHVLMILGQVNGEPYVMQDVPYAVFRDPAGKVRMTKLNQVSVTPLLPLLADEQHLYVDAMTSLVHVAAR
jgi:cell wall-associated NlpC family hydrolase